MKSNEDLQRDVLDALNWEPLLHAAEIGVTAKDGVVTLSGIVDKYNKKLHAEDAAKNVAGVKAVVENIEVNFYDNPAKKNDSEIAKEVVNALKWSWEVPNDKVKVKVEKGWITLDGEVEWNYQKEAAENLINYLDGVKGVFNYIKIKSESMDQIEKGNIERALARNRATDDQNIRVKVSGNTVTLSGSVHSWYQKQEAGRISWNAPGVSEVNNEIVIHANNGLKHGTCLLKRLRTNYTLFSRFLFLVAQSKAIDTLIFV